jgi:hypothetical protein
MTTFYTTIRCHDDVHACVIEDNGHVAYAYLLAEGSIISDLWLYNQGPTPHEPEWRDGTKMPFLNSSAYVDASRMATPLHSETDLAVSWNYSGARLASVTLHLYGHLYGQLIPFANPGLCVAALKDGPLAKKLNDCNQPQIRNEI